MAVSISKYFSILINSNLEISTVIVVTATEYEECRKIKMRIIIKDVIPERQVIVQVLEKDIFKLK
jgi:hypothetical protein